MSLRIKVRFITSASRNSADPFYRKIVLYATKYTELTPVISIGGNLNGYRNKSETWKTEARVSRDEVAVEVAACGPHQQDARPTQKSALKETVGNSLNYALSLQCGHVHEVLACARCLEREKKLVESLFI